MEFPKSQVVLTFGTVSTRPGICHIPFAIQLDLLSFGVGNDDLKVSSQIL